MKRTLFTVFAILIILHTATSQGFIGKKETSVFKKEADQLIDRIKQRGLLNAHILVAQKDQIVYERQVGFADLDQKTPFSMDTKFRIGSITKCFTAISFLQLQEKGKIDVMDPVAKYLPDFPNGEDITLHHLLSHTSGLARDVRFDFSSPITVDGLLEKADLKTSRFEPGSKMSYSNVGYLVLTKIFEKVTGQRIEQYFQKNIMAPLGMKDTGLEKPDVQYANFATGYKLDADEQGILSIQEADPIFHEVYRGVGALYSTPQDLLSFVRALGSSEILSEASWKKMFEGYGRAGNGLDYGYGMFVYQDEEELKLNHSGRINGFRVGFLYNPKQDLSILFSGNHDLAERDDILFNFDRILSNEAFKMPVDRKYRSLPNKKIKKVLGRYKAEDFEFEIKMIGDQLVVVSHGDPPTPLLPADPNIFYALYYDLVLSFEYEGGGPNSGEWNYRGQGVKFKKIE